MKYEYFKNISYISNFYTGLELDFFFAFLNFYKELLRMHINALDAMLIM